MFQANQFKHVQYFDTIAWSTVSKVKSGQVNVCSFINFQVLIVNASHECCDSECTSR